MNETIYPRSPREKMCGWIYLPRYIDKIRLHLAGRLDEGYQSNFGKGFDAYWLKQAGVTHEALIEVVKQTITDGQVADWVCRNIMRTDAEKQVHAEYVLSRPLPDDATLQERLAQSKEASGLGARDDIKTFVDLIDADEKRL